MEKYQVLERLTPGALGVNMVVEESSSKEKLVIKQQTRVHRARAASVSAPPGMQEPSGLQSGQHCVDPRVGTLMPLLKLQHAHISTYRELFILWDHECCSVYLCLVLEHSEGSFQQVIESKRTDRAVIGAEWLLSVLGQAMDALEYLHHLAVIHRNLKPSNIALVSPGHCRLQDLSSHTLMSDEAKWNVRAEEDPLQKSWMAPEALSYNFSTKSDIWSLGCIILDMLSCSFLDAAEAMQLRKSIRTLPAGLGNVLRAAEQRQVPAANIFSALLPSMLQAHPGERMAIQAVIQATFRSSSLRGPAARTVQRPQDVPVFVANMLLESSVASIIEVMKNLADQPEIQLRALRKLLQISEAQRGLPWPMELVELVIPIMRQHERLPDIQLCACALLQSVLGQALAQDPAAEVPRDSALALALLSVARSHPRVEPLLVSVYSLLTIVCREDSASEELQAAGVFEHILGHLDGFSQNRDICVNCLSLLWTLLVDAVITNKAPLEKALVLVARVLAAYPRDVEIAEAGCAVLWLLSAHGCVEEERFVQVVALLLRSLRLCPGRVLLVINACRGLASLARVSELAAFQVVLPGEAGNGLALIVETYQAHRDDPEVVENICLLLARLAAYQEIAWEMVSSDMEPLILEMKGRFSSSLTLVSYAEEILLALGAAQAPCTVSVAGHEPLPPQTGLSPASRPPCPDPTLGLP
ncbi:PREDICTED: serine/threonine kinase-like domain-containing protein STKLD1 [Condylura cristata]|uniref:serine/threonine kinase-like domain-containing protein STKLD1 n=1 Tax=Condylura cristata TaxID=143302 RepID=UPI000642867F|nr:PREDICTED: serine/threonine kinase-like domain-containing protein STKLD1 [Condylura cristata]